MKGDVLKRGAKKRVVIIIPIFFVLLILNFILAADVAYIAKNSRKVDNGFLEAFKELELSVDIIYDKNIDNFNFSDYKFILLGNGKLKKINKIPADTPIILASQFHGNYFGFLNKGRPRKKVTNSGVSVLNIDKEIKIYDKPNKSRISIGYYYIPDRYKNDEFDSVVRTSIVSKYQGGHIILFSKDKEKRKCFFGIVKASYWTEESKNLFVDCVKFVYPEIGKHDVKIDETYSNSINGIRIKDEEADKYLLDEISELQCNKKYKIDFKTINVGGFAENITINGSLGNFTWDSFKEDLLPGKSTTTGSKTFTVNFEPANYNVVVSSNIENDLTPENNIKSRKIKVVCDE